MNIPGLQLFLLGASVAAISGHLGYTVGKHSRLPEPTVCQGDPTKCLTRDERHQRRDTKALPPLVMDRNGRTHREYRFEFTIPFPSPSEPVRNPANLVPIVDVPTSRWQSSSEWLEAPQQLEMDSLAVLPDVYCTDDRGCVTGLLARILWATTTRNLSANSNIAPFSGLPCTQLPQPTERGEWPPAGCPMRVEQKKAPGDSLRKQAEMVDMMGVMMAGETQSGKASTIKTDEDGYVICSPVQR